MIDFNALTHDVAWNGEVYTAGLSSQVKQDRISEWHRESEVCERNPAEVEAEFQKEFWGEG